MVSPSRGSAYTESEIYRNDLIEVVLAEAMILSLL